MRKVIVTMIAAFSLLSAASAEASAIWMAGTSSGAGSLGNWEMRLNYGNPPVNPPGTYQVLQSATLYYGGSVLSMNITNTATPATANSRINVLDGSPNPALDRLRIFGGFLTGEAVDLFVQGDVNISPLTATDANIAALSKLGNAVSGNFTDLSANSITFTGSVIAPEPGSVAILTGLGLVVGRRIWKRRSAKKQNVVAA